jgi:hypothetical protein
MNSSSQRTAVGKTGDEAALPYLRREGVAGLSVREIGRRDPYGDSQ